MIGRRAFIRGATVAVLAAPLPAKPPPTARKVPRIGVLGEANPVPWTVRTSAAEIECRWADHRSDRLEDLAAEVVRLDVDVVVAIGAPAARAVKRLTKTLPIVFLAGGDPVEQGLVASAARPGGNVTGLLVPSDADAAAERLRLLAEIVPGARSIAMLSNPDSLTSARALEHLCGKAWQIVDPSLFQARSAADIEWAFTAMRRGGIEGLLVLPDALFAIHSRRLVDLAAESGIPALYGARSFAEAGGLMALHGDTAEVIRRATAMVARILEGTMPATLPVESLAHLELTVNVDAARTLGLALPRSLLARADAVIGTPA